MKRIILALFLVIGIVMSSISVSAQGAISTIYHAGETEIIFGESSRLSATEREQVVVLLTEGNNGVAPAALACLNGHNYTYETVTSITHKEFDVQPRCVKELYTLGTCTRCGHMTLELITSFRITCCD